MSKKRCAAVLVVEDDPEIQDMVRAVLQAEGYRVDVASNGKEALEVLADLPRPCLLLVDLLMPVMDGWQLMKALKDKDAFANIPVAVVSGAADRGGLEGTRVLKKPIDMQSLLDTVRDLAGDPA